MSEYDLHLFKTKASIKQVKRIIKTDIFGNYNVVEIGTPEKEFGLIIFRSGDYTVVKLDYTFPNYKDVSQALTDALGCALRTDCWVVGLEIERSAAFIRHYQYNDTKKAMVFFTSLNDSDGLKLTPQAKERWGFDSHSIWMKVTDNMTWEGYRQMLKYDNTVRKGIHYETIKANIKKKWDEKFQNKRSLSDRFCETMYFVARKEIEQYRPDSKKLVVEKTKLGKIVLEQVDGGETIRTVIPDTGEETKN